MAYCENLLAEDFGGRRRDGSTALSDSGESPISSHFFGQSSFATHANVVESSVIRVDPAAPLETLAPLGCGMQTGAGAIINELRPDSGSSVLVTGAGAVGLAAVMAARVVGCTTVVAADLHDNRLDLARRLGATHVVNSGQEELGSRVSEITGGRGIDYAVDTTAVPAVLRTASDALAIRGTLALVGAASPGTEAQFEIGGSLVKGWTFRTIVQGSSVPQRFIPRLVELWQQGRFPFDELVQPYSLDEVNTAFADSESGRVVKPVVVF